jgi:transposase-like protein
MTNRVDDPTTAYGLAISNGLDFWPGRCPSCGGTDRARRPIEYVPGDRGRARYFCLDCQTHFERTLFEVSQYVARLPR